MPERDLLDEIARYKAILSSTLDPIVTMDIYGIIQVASDSIERIFGWRPDELVGQNVSVLMTGSHRANHDSYLAKYRKSGETKILDRSREFMAVHRDGTEFPIELRVSRTQIPGGDELFTGIISDITDRKRSEDELAQHRDQLQELVEERTSDLEASHEQLRLADRLAAIGTLAAGVGHDMANILLPVRCRLDAMDAQDLSKVAREHITAFRKSVDYLQQLADGLHLLSLDPEDACASSEGTDLAAWWEQVGSLLTRGLPKHVQLETALPDDLPRVAIPPHRLTQAVLNLVVNAGEAVGDDGTVRIWAELSDGGRTVRVGVTDDGPGMPLEVSRRAFDPFFTTKTRGLGTGLGLSLVQGVVRAAGGSVSIDTAPRRGTTVQLSLPVQTRDETGATVAGGERATISLGDGRVATLVAVVLEGAGYTVELDTPVSPDARLWVTDASIEALACARDYLNEPHRRVLVAGPAGPQWSALDGAQIVEDPNDFEAWRESIAEVISSLMEATS